MTNQSGVAILAGLCLGLFNAFTKGAANRLPNVIGAFVVEGTALVCFTLIMVSSRNFVSANSGATSLKVGVIYSVAAGLAVAAGTILTFKMYSLDGDLTTAGVISLVSSIALTALIGVVAFGEPITIRHAVGWVLAAIAIVLLAF